MRRFILFVLTFWLAFPPHAESQDNKLPAHAIARIGTTRFQVSQYRDDMLLAPDGKRLAVNNPIDGIDVWQLPAWTKERTITIDSIDPDIEARFACLAFTPDSKNLLIFNAGTEQIVLFDLAAGNVVKRIAMPQDGPFRDCFIVATTDKKSCVFTWDDPGTRKQAFAVFDLENGRVERSCKFDVGHRPKKLLYSSDGNTLLAVDAVGLVRNFDLKNGKEIPNPANLGGDPLAFSPDGKSLFLRKADGTILHATWDDFTVLARYESLRANITQIGLPPNGKPIALGIRGTTVSLWDIATGKPLSPTDVPSGAVSNLTFSTKGELFIAAENGHAAWWNPRTAVKLRDAKPNRVAPMNPGQQTSPDGYWQAAIDNKERILISRADGRGGRKPVELRIPGHEFSALAFSPDGRQLACATVDPFSSPMTGPIFIYEVSSKNIRLELPGHPAGAIERLAYAADSALLASAATDAQVLVWNAGVRPHMQAAPNRKPTTEDLNDWYLALTRSDARAAFQSMIKLAEAPTQAAKFFADKIAPAPKLDTEGRTVAQWIGDLGSGKFAVRSKANAVLLKLGPSAERELREVLRKPPDLEVKRRIEELLDRIAAAGDFTPTDILHCRAVEVLEAARTPEARALLMRWSAGDPGAVLTIEARQALARLER